MLLVLLCLNAGQGLFATVGSTLQKGGRGNLKWCTRCAQHMLSVNSVARSCLTLCDPLDCSPPDSSVHGIIPARVLEWVAIPSSRESSWSRDQTDISSVSCIDRWILHHWGTWEALVSRTDAGNCRALLTGLLALSLRPLAWWWLWFWYLPYLGDISEARHVQNWALSLVSPPGQLFLQSSPL